MTLARGFTAGRSPCSPRTPTATRSHPPSRSTIQLSTTSSAGAFLDVLRRQRDHQRHHPCRPEHRHLRLRRHQGRYADDHRHRLRPQLLVQPARDGLTRRRPANWSSTLNPRRRRPPDRRSAPSRSCMRRTSTATSRRAITARWSPRRWPAAPGHSIGTKQVTVQGGNRLLRQPGGRYGRDPHSQVYAGTLPPVISDPSTVSPAVPTSLWAMPGNWLPGGIPRWEASSRGDSMADDAYNNVAASFNSPVTLSLASGSAGTLTGNLDPTRPAPRASPSSPTCRIPPAGRSRGQRRRRLADQHALG